MVYLFLQLRHHHSPQQDRFNALHICAEAKGYCINTESNLSLAKSLDNAVDSNDPEVNKVVLYLYLLYPLYLIHLLSICFIHPLYIHVSIHPFIYSSILLTSNFLSIHHSFILGSTYVSNPSYGTSDVLFYWICRQRPVLTLWFGSGIIYSFHFSYQKICRPCGKQMQSTSYKVLLVTFLV